MGAAHIANCPPSPIAVCTVYSHSPFYTCVHPTLSLWSLSLILLSRFHHSLTYILPLSSLSSQRPHRSPFSHYPYTFSLISLIFPSFSLTISSVSPYFPPTTLPTLRQLSLSYSLAPLSVYLQFIHTLPSLSLLTLHSSHSPFILLTDISLYLPSPLSPHSSYYSLATLFLLQCPFILPPLLPLNPSTLSLHSILQSEMLTESSSEV